MKHLIVLSIFFLSVISATCQGRVKTSRNTADHDWYSETTGRQPRSIEDSIFTYGDVGINTSTPNDALDVLGSFNVKDEVIGAIAGTNEYYLRELIESLRIESTGFAPGRTIRYNTPGNYDIDCYNDFVQDTFRTGITLETAMFGGRPQALYYVERKAGEETQLTLSDSISLGNTLTDFTGIRIHESSVDKTAIWSNTIRLVDFPSSRDDSGATTPTNFLYTDPTGNLLSAPVSGLGGGASALNDLSDVNTAGLTTDDVLTYTGSTWQPVALPSIADSLNELGDVNAGSPTVDDVLTWDGAEWVAQAPTAAAGDMSGFKAEPSSNISFTTASWEKITMTSEVWDSEGWYNTSTGAFKPDEAGYYLVGGLITVSQLSDGNKLLVAVYKNGTLEALLGRGVSGGTDFTGYGGSSIFSMNGTTDSLELYAYCNEASPQVSGTAGYSSWWATKLELSNAADSGTFTLNDLVDVSAASPSTNEVLAWNGSAWAPAAAAAQTISRTGTDVTLSDGGGTVSIADNDNDASNEIQTISKTGTDVTLSDGGGTVSIADNDNDASNEIQTLSLSGSDLSISGGNTVTLPSGGGGGYEWSIYNINSTSVSAFSLKTIELSAFDENITGASFSLATDIVTLPAGTYKVMVEYEVSGGDMTGTNIVEMPCTGCSIHAARSFDLNESSRSSNSYTHFTLMVSSSTIDLKITAFFDAARTFGNGYLFIEKID